MTNRRKGLASGIVIFALVVLGVVVIVLGAMVYNLNSHLAIIDQNGRELTDWAKRSATWSTHANNDHLKQDHIAENLAPDHIAPPPDPPPDW